MNVAVKPHTDRLLRTPAERLAPQHTALIVVDMQNDFCAERSYVEEVMGKDASACRAVAKPIMALVKDARAAGVPVFWIRANYDLDKLPAGMAVRFGARGDGRVCCGTGSWGIGYYGVEPAPGEAEIEKHCFSGFMGTDLDGRLRTLGIRSLVFAGVQTNVCVDATLRDALARGFYVSIAADCCASHTVELHDATIKNVRLAMGDVLNGSEVASFWKPAA